MPPVVGPAGGFFEAAPSVAQSRRSLSITSNDSDGSFVTFGKMVMLPVLSVERHPADKDFMEEPLKTDILASDSDAAAIKRTQEDLRLVARAIRHGWNVPAEARPVLVERLKGIVEKKTCTVMSKEGPVDLDGPADQNAIAAFKALVDADKVDQTDHWNEDKNTRIDSGKATDVLGVNQVEIVVPALPALPPSE